MTQRAAPKLLNCRFVIACRRAKHGRRVAQLAGWHEIAVVPNAGAFDEPPQGRWALVALETGQHRCADGYDEESRPKQVGGEFDRLLRVCLGGCQIPTTNRKVR